jgi:demethylmenaquinone methyltransferase/2-methoxy-6-polyprenyl-1,4-benzoquinol methylase
MDAGRERDLREIRWLAGTGEAIPLADGSVDTVTIAFGIRNVTSMESALAEILRVLRPGGRFLCLEFSRPVAPVRPFYEVFNRTVIPRLGAWVSRNPEAYRYLIESIRRFPDQREMQGILETAGFVDVRWRNQSFGIACLHEGTRPPYARHA